MKRTCLTLCLVFFLSDTNNGHLLQNGDILDIFQVVQTLDEVLQFVDEHYHDINIDGLLGITIAQAQLAQTLKRSLPDYLSRVLDDQLSECERLHNKIKPLIEMKTEKDTLFSETLLNYRFWMKEVEFSVGILDDLEIYTDWTSEDILENKHAEYKGVPTDRCLLEVIEENIHHKSHCEVSQLCEEMMFEDRIDTGYLLTHRLLYLQISEQTECISNSKQIRKLKKFYCSLMLKEARTNERLGFPQHDIFLEQMVLCGMEGYTEFTSKTWRETIEDWRTPQGCYRANTTEYRFEERSTNVISFECTDHTTGLAAAALATNLRHILSH